MSGPSSAPKIKKQDGKKIANPLDKNSSTTPASLIIAEARAAQTTGNFGLFCTKLIEPIPNFISAECEKIISQDGINANIVFGRDRPSTLKSGYGGAGSQQSAMIDIVVGRSGPAPKTVDENGEKFWVDNNFQVDAARIYISQRTDIDDNMKIRPYEPLEPSIAGGSSMQTPGVSNALAVSAIGMKADCIRLAARRDLKIVTGTDLYDMRGLKPGVDYELPPRIVLIGDNRGDLIQPMVKGYSLMKYLYGIDEVLNGIISTIQRFAENQNKVNQYVMNHTHVSPFYGFTVPPSGDLFQAMNPIIKTLTDVYNSCLETTGKLTVNNKLYIDSPDDGMINNNNILSNYNWCN